MKKVKIPDNTPDRIEIRTFPPAEKWAWFCILCLASQQDEGGEILKDDEDIAAYCGFPTVEDWQLFKEKLDRKSLIEITTDDTIQVRDWNRFYGQVEE